MSKEIGSKVKKIVADHLGVEEEKVVDEASFISAVKTQNPEIAGKIDAGSEFRVVFTKEHKLKEGEKPYVDNETNSSYQVVVRVNEDIRQILKEKGDRIYIDPNVRKKYINKFHQILLKGGQISVSIKENSQYGGISNYSFKFNANGYKNIFRY